MNTTLTKSTWVYAIVLSPGGPERFFGQHDPEKDISFIPFFIEKEDAQSCALNMTRGLSEKHEVQAIIYEDLCLHSVQSKFLLYQLDGDGKVLDIIKP